jgi:hypothetical protein
MCNEVLKFLSLRQLEHKVQKYETILDTLQLILGLSTNDMETLPHLIVEAFQREEEYVTSVHNLVKSLDTLQRAGMRSNGRTEPVLRGPITTPINPSRSKLSQENWSRVDRSATMVREHLCYYFRSTIFTMFSSRT